jgi:hypothetical protein
MGLRVIGPLRGVLGISLQQRFFHLLCAVARLFQARLRFKGSNAQPASKRYDYQ